MSVPRRALCQANIKRGGGIRHVATMRDTACILCLEPLVYDRETGYWFTWVICEQP